MWKKVKEKAKEVIDEVREYKEKRELLDSLSKDELFDLALRYEIAVSPKMTKDEMISKIAKSKALTKANIIQFLRETKLQVAKRETKDIKAKATTSKKKLSLEEEHIRERITEREIIRKRVTAEINDKKLLEEIKAISFTRSEKEKGYEIQLYQWLSGKGYPVEHESTRKGARFDLVLGKDDVAIELKVVRSTSVFDSLFGQVDRYKDQFRKIIVVLIDEIRNPDIMKREIARLEKLDPERIKVIQK
jgi:rRNA maturation endonuclease Nob1